MIHFLFLNKKKYAYKSLSCSLLSMFKCKQNVIKLGFE
uniref:Uncharacterized protein n=1 Tax=Anguilla anguilla TaxID=7936 RepID=A0A0E9XME1_ANGAN